MAARPLDARTLALTLVALVAFAANSLLCRLALAPRLVDAATFTLVRIVAGALTLVVLTAVTRDRRRGGSWASALALIAYAACFSFAYLRLGAAVGALVLFGVVQLTMIGFGIARGERPGAREWAGLALALAGLVWLTRPGASAPDPLGTALMAAAGAAWGIYSLRARGAASPLAATADNFLRAVPAAVVLSLLAFAESPAQLHVTSRGVALAAASGAFASGIGYGIWYAALRGLSAARAAIVQLLVPVLASVGAVALLGERLGGRLVGAGLAILAGVAVALVSRRARR